MKMGGKDWANKPAQGTTNKVPDNQTVFITKAELDRKFKAVGQMFDLAKERFIEVQANIDKLEKRLIEVEKFKQWHEERGHPELDPIQEEDHAPRIIRGTGSLGRDDGNKTKRGKGRPRKTQ